jgi:hypothetical protein
MYGTRTRRIKTDRRDVAALADANRTGVYRPACRLSPAQRVIRQRLLVRDQLVRMRTQLINVLRSQVRATGQRVPTGDAETFSRRFATLDRVKRFPDAGRATAYLGLVPREHSPAERRHRGAITKAGPGRPRALLVPASWHIWRSGRGGARDHDVAGLEIAMNHLLVMGRCDGVGECHRQFIESRQRQAFGLLHLSNPNATPWGVLAIAATAGVLLAAAFVLTRRLWLPIGVHFGVNWAQGPLLGLPVSGTERVGLLAGSLEGPAVFTGGEFGLEASLLLVVTGGAVALAVARQAYRRGHFVSPMWSDRRRLKSGGIFLGDTQ